MPKIYVENVNPSKRLYLAHEFDGRELELSYAQKTLDHARTLWAEGVELKTMNNKKIMRL